MPFMDSRRRQPHQAHPNSSYTSQYPNQSRVIPQPSLGLNSDTHSHAVHMHHQYPVWLDYPNLDAQVGSIASTSANSLGLFDRPTRQSQDHVHPLSRGPEHLHMGITSPATQSNPEAMLYYGPAVPDLSDRIVSGSGGALHSPVWPLSDSPFEPITTQPVDLYHYYRRPPASISSGPALSAADWATHDDRSSMAVYGIETSLEDSSSNILSSIDTQHSDIHDTSRSSLDLGVIASSQTSPSVFNHLPSPPPYEPSEPSHSPTVQPVQDSAEALAEFVRASFPSDTEDHAKKRRALKAVMTSQWRMRHAFEPDENALLQFMKHDRKRSRWFCSFWKDNRPCESSCRKKDHAKGHIRFHIQHFPYVCQRPCPRDGSNCGKRYSAAEPLSKHRNPRVQCNVCGMPMLQGNLPRHQASACRGPAMFDTSLPAFRTASLL
ncbi:hypothetical protein CPB86DRAFT_494251 [Serendipita vermifera]|nr:hypothetical protein CPB86DRAFT_494251 [Serendipita vermifera]